MNILKQLFTGQDNTTHDLGRWSWAISIGAVIAAAGANWWHQTVVDLMQLAQSLAVVAGAHGAALWAKRDTEPK